MGQEISTSHFTPADFERFRDRLHEETALLASWIASQSEEPPTSNKFTIGFELEAWLVDLDCNPTPTNQTYLKALNDPLVGPELAKFNVELNTTPLELAGNCFQIVQAEFDKTWERCCKTARQSQANLIAIGILPTVTPEHLTLANMSEMVRYRALNERVMNCHEHGKICLEIDGIERWQSFHSDLVVEAAATSFQIHLQVPPASAARYFNAACIASAPLVAISANAPYLFGRKLWCETRIPVFEQVMAAPGLANIPRTSAACPASRVNFGCDYIHHSLLESFEENRDRYPILLPIQLDDNPATFSHLRLHNGTIWRWNRPLVGFDPDGTPHLRLEHRVIPAGPTTQDTIANAVFFFGLTHALATLPEPPETSLSYNDARANFYAAARHSLDAKMTWLDKSLGMRKFLAEAIALADEGLQALQIDPGDRQTYLDIIRNRLQTGQTGAAWQRAYVAKHGADMQALTATYLARQTTSHPVHTWTV